jgi:hypothetical protein
MFLHATTSIWVFTFSQSFQNGVFLAHLTVLKEYQLFSLTKSSETWSTQIVVWLCTQLIVQAWLTKDWKINVQFFTLAKYTQGPNNSSKSLLEMAQDSTSTKATAVIAQGGVSKSTHSSKCLIVCFPSSACSTPLPLVAFFYWSFQFTPDKLLTHLSRLKETKIAEWKEKRVVDSRVRREGTGLT